MDTSMLLGVWTGNVHNNNGWDMKITISILKPFDTGDTLGIFDIPLIPCSGTFRVINIRGHILDLQVENCQGDCEEADSDSLEVLPDGTMKYISKGKGWETKGVLRRSA
jgi:hypothetical protein